MYCIRAVGAAYPQSHVTVRPMVLPESRRRLNAASPAARTSSSTAPALTAPSQSWTRRTWDSTSTVGSRTAAAGAAAVTASAPSIPMPTHSAARTIIGRRMPIGASWAPTA